MVLAERITATPGVMFGKPCVQGTRLAVDFIMDLLTAGATEEYLLHNYPRLTRDDILACISYAGRIVDEVERFPHSA